MTDIYARFAGRAVLLRTVTLYYVGRLVEIQPLELGLEEAAWIPDMGRFGEALASGEMRQHEPFPDGLVIVNRSMVVDCSLWSGPLYRVAK